MNEETHNIRVQLSALQSAFMECVANKERSEHENFTLRDSLAQRITQVAQLTADGRGYRERLAASNALIVILKDELRGAKSLMKIDAENGSLAYAGAIDRINAALKK